MPVIIHPASEDAWFALRVVDVTSTESAALVGLHKRLTPFELYQRKVGAYVEAFEETERTKWGLRLQDPIARGIAEDYGVKVRRLNCYVRHDSGARMGASFDYEIVGLGDAENDVPMLGERSLRSLYQDLGPGLLEIKNVDGLVFRNDWLNDEDGIEAPAYIEVQLQHQLEVMDREWGVIAALVGGNQPIVIVRRRDRDVGKALVDRINLLWRQVEHQTPPDPNFRRDLKVIAKLYGYADPDKVLDASADEALSDLLLRHYELGQQVKTLTEDRDALKAEALTKIGTAEKVLLKGGYTLTAGMVGPAEVSYTRQGYRMFKVNRPSKKKAKAAA